MSPPPPDVARTYLEKLHLDYVQRSNEFEEVRRLKRDIELRKLQMELADLSPVRPQRRSIDFYSDQLAVWFNNLPAAARQVPRSMDEFLSILKGRTPGMRPHAPEIAQALKSQRWSRKRCWKSDGEGRRLWYPPGALFTPMS